MEQWILWMIINVFSITMWSLLLGTPEGSVTMIIMFSAYLINGVYGLETVKIKQGQLVTHLSSSFDIKIEIYLPLLKLISYINSFKLLYLEK